MMWTRCFEMSLVLLATVVLSFRPALAQITITDTDLRAQFTSQLTTTTFDAVDPSELQSLVQLTGGSRTWDFSAAQFEQGHTSSVDVVAPPVPGSDDPDFASANLIIRSNSDVGGSDSLVYTFARLHAGGLEILGMYMEADVFQEVGAESVTGKYRPPLLVQKLPLTMGTTWEAKSELHMDIEDWPVLAMEDSVWVDGWGTLVTPHGSAAALRLMSRSVISTSIEIPGFPPIVFQDTTLSVEFRTRGALSATLTLDDDGSVQSADYTVASGGGGLANEVDGILPETFDLLAPYPNPFNPQTVIPYTLRQPGHATLQVLDPQGRLVETLVDRVEPAGHYSAFWQPVGMASGTYLVRLSVNGSSTTRSVSLVK